MDRGEPRKIIETHKSVGEITESMATEICNLRGINLTDDNIRLIVEEFSK